MLFTTLVAAVAVGITPASQPKWQPDYPTAVRVAASQQKPLAVFVGHGQAGFAQLVTDAAATQALGDKFVSVYIDADTAAGQPLAQALKVTDGLVISDRGGAVVALRHQGPVAPAALTTYLTTYASDAPVLQTVQAGTLAAPVYAAPVYAPSYAYPTVGGCANGRCGPQPFGGVVSNVFGGLMGGGGCANGQCGRPTLFR